MYNSTVTSSANFAKFYLPTRPNNLYTVISVEQATVSGAKLYMVGDVNVKVVINYMYEHLFLFVLVQYRFHQFSIKNVSVFYQS